MRPLPQLDSCARLQLGPRRRIGSYLALGSAGALTGAAVVILLSVASGQSGVLATVAIASTICAFLAGVKAAQILLGYERIVLYELFLLALATTAATLALGELPVRAGLDLAVIGIGTMLIFGRIGCLRVGCCHGRPASWGIVYGEDHARAGFLRCYVGVRLFAVQLVESAMTLAIVAICIRVYLAYPAGQALCLYASLYGAGRFGLELLRGDDDRPHLGGVSEAQWLAVVTGVAAAWAGHAWTLPLAGVHATVAVTLMTATAALVVTERTRPGRAWWFRHPRRRRELAEALRRLLATVDDAVRVVDTPSGLRLSCSRDRDGLLLGLSCPARALSTATARSLSRATRRATGLALTGPEPGRTPGFFVIRLERSARAAREPAARGLDAR